MSPFRLKQSCGFVLLCLIGAAKVAFAYTMQDAVQQTLMTHPDILSNKAEELATLHDIRAIKGEYLPSFDVEAGYGRENSDNPATRATPGRHDRTLTRQESEFLLRQLLFDGWNVKSRVQQRTGDYEANKFETYNVQETLAQAAARAYLNVLRNRELVQVRRLDVKAHRDTLAKVQKRLKAGAGRKSEVNLAKSRLALSQARYELAQGDLDDSNDTFERVVGRRPPNSMANVSKPNGLPRSEDEAQDMAVDLNPGLSVTRAQFEAASAGVRVARSNYYPIVTAEVTGTFSDDLDGVKGHNNDAMAMLRLTYNVFRGGIDRAGVNAALERETAARYDIDNTRREVLESVSLAWNAMRTSQDRIPYLRAHRRESAEVFDAYAKQFQLGQRTLFDLLNAQTELYDARTNLVNGLYDLKISYFGLLASMGNLVNHLSGGGVEAVTLETETVYTSPEPISPSRARPALTMSDASDQIDTAKPSVQAKTQLAMKETDDSHYTLQLLAARSSDTLDKFIATNHLDNKASYYPTTVDGKTWYRLVYGDFASKARAEEAAAELPNELKSLHPMIRSYASVKRTMNMG